MLLYIILREKKVYKEVSTSRQRWVVLKLANLYRRDCYTYGPIQFPEKLYWNKPQINCESVFKVGVKWVGSLL